MLPDRVSNPGPATYESGALPIALRGPAYRGRKTTTTTKIATTSPRITDCNKTFMESQMFIMDKDFQNLIRRCLHIIGVIICTRIKFLTEP